MNEAKMESGKNWFSTLLSYAKGSGKRLLASVVLSVVSLSAGIIPYYCIYRILDK